jgi:hypothetical protein
MAERHTPTAEVEMSVQVSTDGATGAPRDTIGRSTVAEQNGEELPS